MKKSVVLFFATFSIATCLFAQTDRWQQAVKYNMNIDMDVTTNRFTGKQKLEYSNNSPVVLNKVFYHLYFNAFQKQLCFWLQWVWLSLLPVLFHGI